MTIKYRYRKQILACVSVFVFFLSLGGFVFYQYSYKHKGSIAKKEVLLSNKKSTVKKTSVLKKKEEETEKKNKEEKVSVKVDIKGEVQVPGLYTLEEGSRVSDVIQLAGGLTEIGDTTVINLSKKIVDEMVIIIYSKEEVLNFKKTQEVYEQVIDQCQNGHEGISNDACISIEEDSNKEESILVTGPISLNTASREELLTLPGIGESKADSILQYREEHGEFTSIEEIKEVNGIGDSLFDKIKENITL
ncbi:MAG: hypothetical protein HFJ38_00555 [Bacilli bacterium]|nr:hypothetical protein [Bacilli bacterium]